MLLAKKPLPRNSISKDLFIISFNTIDGTGGGILRKLKLALPFLFVSFGNHQRPDHPAAEDL